MGKSQFEGEAVRIDPGASGAIGVWRSHPNGQTSALEQAVPSFMFWFVKTRVLLIVICSIAAVTPSQADNEISRQFDELLLDRDRAVGSAVAPINARYVQELERLYRRAVEAKDMETAARIKPVMEVLKLATSPRSGKEALVGAWSFKNESDGHTGSVELHADHSYTSSGKRVGQWRVEGKQIVITLDEGGHEDRYDLPLNGGKLKGTNRVGQTVILTRLPQDPLNVL